MVLTAKMAHKKVLINIMAIFVCQNASALRCYHCSSVEPDKTCFDPIDTNEVQSADCDQNNSNVTRMFSRNTNYNQLRSAYETSEEFECAVYQRFYRLHNETDIFRRCIPKSPTNNFCDLLIILGTVDEFDVTQCETCNTDDCNGPKPTGVAAAILPFYSFLGHLSMIFLVAVAFK